MAALWRLSNVPQNDADGAPLVGAKLYFYDAETSTPQSVYSDSGLSIAHDSPVVADARGAWPTIYQSPGTFRERATDAAGGTVLFDNDGISVPQGSDLVPVETGDTDAKLLFSTGDLLYAYRTSAKSGWVRAAGRTIGSATSGASERANADCQPLFLFLWAQDANLAVSGGRGGTAAGDWAANKTIALPDLRDRLLIGLGDMGNSDANRIADSLTDGPSTNTTLGATAGISTVTLTLAQMPTHGHTGNTSSDGAHTHTFPISSGDTPDAQAAGGSLATAGNATTSSSGTHNHSFTTDANGGGTAHTNLQPGMFSTVYIKL